MQGVVLTRRRIALTVCLGFLSPLAAAAELRPASESDYFNELPVVLSVSRLAQSLKDTPAAVTVIDRELIRVSGAREVWELMRLVPGFQVSPVVGGAPGVTYHGLTEQFPRRVQILVDGRSQYSPFFLGGVNWNMVPVSLDDIERIEVIRGSNAAAYGSNAFLGVINIITRHAADDPGLSASGNDGNQGVRDSRLRWSGRFGDGALRVSAEEHRDFGLDKQLDDRRTRRLDLRGDFRLGLRDELQLHAGHVESDIGVGDLAANSTDLPRSQNLESLYLMAVWRRNLADDEDLSLRYEHTQEVGRDRFMATTKVGPFPVVVPLDFNFRSLRHDLELQHTRAFRGDLRVVSGVGYRSDEVISPGFFARPDPVSLSVLRVFGNLEWRPGMNWLSNFGATWEHDSLSGTTFSPRIGVSYHLADGHTLRAVAARAYRTPSLLESRGNQRFQTLPVPPLLPDGILKHGFFSTGVPEAERLDAFELGYLGEWRPLAMRIDVRAFSEHVKDRAMFAGAPLSPPNCDQPAAILILCGDASAAANFEDVVIGGVEYQLQWRPAETSRVLLNQSFIRLRPSYHDVPVKVKPSNFMLIRRHTESSAPTHSTSLILSQRLPLGFDFGAGFHSVGAMRWTDSSFASSYHRLDWRLGYAFRFGVQRGELAFTRQSDNRAHGEHSDRELVTPRKFLSLRLDL